MPMNRPGPRIGGAGGFRRRDLEVSDALCEQMYFAVVSDGKALHKLGDGALGATATIDRR